MKIFKKTKPFCLLSSKMLFFSWLLCWNRVQQCTVSPLLLRKNKEKSKNVLKKLRYSWRFLGNCNFFHSGPKRIGIPLTSLRKIQFRLCLYPLLLCPFSQRNPQLLTVGGCPSVITCQRKSSLFRKFDILVWTRPSTVYDAHVTN